MSAQQPQPQPSSEHHNDASDQKHHHHHHPAAAAAVVGMPAINYLERIEQLTEKIDQPDPVYEYGVHGFLRGTGGGMKFVLEDVMARQNGVLGDVVRSLGSAILNGKSLINISLPVRLFEPRSVLERITDVWAFAPLFLTRAAYAQDPIERIKWCITFVVSGFHRGFTNGKPFNPILGETYQAHYNDGTQICLEQVCHHPPITQFLLVGPENIYKYYGHHEFSAAIRPNSVTGQQIGTNTIEFLDGTKITFNLPFVYMTGIMWGDRNFQWQGNMKFEDEKNHLLAEVFINPNEKGALSRLFSSSAPSPADTIRGEICRIRKIPAPKGNQTITQKDKASAIDGSWMEGIIFDKKHYWTKQSIKPFMPIPDDDPLQSDCRFRQDLIYLRANDEPNAQIWKEKLEAAQRADKHLRKKYAEIAARLVKSSSRASIARGNHHRRKSSSGTL